MANRNGLTRRAALSMIGAGAAGGALYGVSRSELLDFLRAEAREPENFRVMRRPYAPEPGREISTLGFGTGSRLPIVNRDKHQIDEELTGGLVDYAIRHGVNYFDTGWAYHFGESERFLGRTLKRYPREEVMLADKMPTWLVKTAEDAPRIFEEQLKRCQVDYFDVYMLHSVSKPEQYEQVYHKLGVLDYLKEQKAKGRIRHLGFSYHGKSDFLERLLDDYAWEAALVLLNALEHRWNPDSPKLPEILARRKVPTFVMEPLAGGRAANLNREALDLLEAEGGGIPASEWAFRYALSFPGVQCLVSSINSEAFVVEDVRTFSVDRFRTMTDADRRFYARVIDAYMRHKTIPCTGCRYCVPCPYGVEIPEVMAWWNSLAGVGRIPADEGANDSQRLRREFLASYSQAVTPGCGAEKCIGCKKCLEACPQWTFKIPDEMHKIDRTLAHVRDVYVAKGGRL